MRKKQGRILAVVICVLLAAGVTQAVVGTQNSETRQKFRQLERDVPSLYLLNGLYLSAEQAGKLLSLMDKQVESETKFWKEFEKVMDRRSGDLQKEVDEIVRHASSGRPPEPKPGRTTLYGKRLLEARQEIQELRNQKQRDQDASADHVYHLLTASQRKIVDGFVPCFVPSSDFRNPERVGQAANDTSFVEKALARLKNVPEDRSTEALDRALDVLVPYAMEKRHIKYSEEAEQSVRDELSERLGAVAPRVRGMSDADFELEKAKLANKVLPLLGSDDPAALRWKLSAYLLNTGIRDVIRSRAGVAGKGDDVGAKPPKDSCNEAVDAKKAVRTALVIRDLELTPEQAKKMRDVVGSALSADQKVQKEADDNMEKALEPYKKLRTELAASQPTPDAERGASHFHQTVRTLNIEKLPADLLKYEAEIDQILTAKQVDVLAREWDKPGMKKGEAANEIDSTLNRAKRVVSEARRMTAMSYSQDKNEFCRKYVNECVTEDGLEKGSIDVDAESKRIGEVMDKARKMDHAEYSQNRDELAAELCPRRNKPRPATYGAKYVKGKPLPELSETSKVLFSQTAFNILEGLARK